MWTYRKFLPIQKPANIVSLGEGNTPTCLLEENLFLKLEHLNPTGSYKDRFASCALSWVKESGMSRCLATSSGNSGAALAAYCARAAVDCLVLLVETTPPRKALQMLAYGAMLKRIRGFGLSAKVTEDVMDGLRRRAEDERALLGISAFKYCAPGMEGVKTIAYELVDTLKSVDDVFVPVGGGGLLTAVFRGFTDFFQRGRISKLPRIHAVQPLGCATVAGPLSQGLARATPVQCESRISGLQVPNVVDGNLAVKAVKQTRGLGVMVSDEAIFSAQKELVRRGIYCEPAGATAYAGYCEALNRCSIDSGRRVVCLVTGHGYKDPESIENMVSDANIELCELENLFK